jgi:hypothetical protein
LLNEISDNQRKIHYTDDGMIPFSIQLENYKKEIEEKEKEKNIEENKSIGKVFKISLKRK